MELGCFLAGALVSSQGHMVTEEIMAYIEPIRDFLAIIFFASIGTPRGTAILSISVQDLSVMSVYKYASLESEAKTYLKRGKMGGERGTGIIRLLVSFHQCRGENPSCGVPEDAMQLWELSGL